MCYAARCREGQASCRTTFTLTFAFARIQSLEAQHLAVPLLFPQAGTSKLLTANSGDARILLVRGNQAIQLTEDHVPDNEDERNRIERFNPNPKLPLVSWATALPATRPGWWYTSKPCAAGLQEPAFRWLSLPPQLAPTTAGLQLCIQTCMPCTST